MITRPPPASASSVFATASGPRARSAGRRAAAEDCWLDDLYVAPQARRLGLGRALVQRTLARARERGCHRVELDTNEDNHSAIRLYRSLGFSDTAKGASRSLFFGARVAQ